MRALCYRVDFEIFVSRFIRVELFVERMCEF